VARSPSRFVVVGAGGIGGSVGAHFARAGHDVLFVDSLLPHVEAIARDGLSVEGQSTFRVRVPAVTPAGLAGALDGRPLETVLLAVKAHHTAAALEAVAPLLDARGVIVSLQNGLNERLIARRVGAERTMGAFVNFGADYLGPGRVKLSSRAELYLGELDGRMTDRLERLGAIFREAFLEHTQLTDNIWGHLWGKLGYVSMLFATATIDDSMGDAFADPRSRSLLANLAGEIVRVADAEGVRSVGFSGYDADAMRFTTPRDWAAIHRCLDQRVIVNRQSLNTHNGIWRDMVIKHRPTEIDAQLGVVVDVARAHGLATPLNERVIDLIHDLEAGRRGRGPANIEELRALNEAVYPHEGHDASQRARSASS